VCSVFFFFFPPRKKNAHPSHTPHTHQTTARTPQLSFARSSLHSPKLHTKAAKRKLLEAPLWQLAFFSSISHFAVMLLFFLTRPPVAFRPQQSASPTTCAFSIQRSTFFFFLNAFSIVVLLYTNPAQPSPVPRASKGHSTNRQALNRQRLFQNIFHNKISAFSANLSHKRRLQTYQGELQCHFDFCLCCCDPSACTCAAPLLLLLLSRMHKGVTHPRHQS
jgi:hypothetical protein